MKAIYANDKNTQKQFLAFRRGLFTSEKRFIDNYSSFLRDIFAGKNLAMRNLNVNPCMIVDDSGNVLCEALLIYAAKLPEYVQVAFFETLPDKGSAIDMLLDEAKELGRKNGATKVVVGLNGHVNYSVGLQDSDYDCVNAFGTTCNRGYYHDHFRLEYFNEIKMNSYTIDQMDNRLERYIGIITSLNRKYEYKVFNKKKFEANAKIFTDLNNECMKEHRYYYPREYDEDVDFLKYMFSYMNDDSIIYAYEGDTPIGFIWWYPDFNELAKPGEDFGEGGNFSTRHHIKDIRTARVARVCVLEPYRKTGLAIALINQMYLSLKNYNINKIITGWILSENSAGMSVSKKVCDRLYKEFVTYETDIN